MQQPNEDLKNVKIKLIEHIKKTYDSQKAEIFISEINAMEETQFIDFLKKQGLLNGNNQNSSKTKCIFCSMVFGDIPTIKIGENEKAIAILELNPVSEGHSLIIPKTHVESENNLSQKSKNLAIQISDQLKKTFEPLKVDYVLKNVMGHEIINLIPVYKNETIDSPRYKETPEKLTKLKNKIESNKTKQNIKESKVKEKKEEINSMNTWLPKRIP